MSEVVGSLGQVGGLEPTDTLEEEAGGHNGLTSNEAGLTVSRTHTLEEVGIRSLVRLHGVDHAGAGVTGNLAEVRVLTQVHHRGRIHDAAVVAVSEGRDVALTHVLDDFQEVGGDIELGGLTRGVGQPRVPPVSPLALPPGR